MLMFRDTELQALNRQCDKIDLEALRERIASLKAAYERQPLAWYAKELREAQEEEARLKEISHALHDVRE